MTEQDSWVETVSELAKLNHNSKEECGRAIGGIVGVVREKAISGKPFAYLRFETAQDCHMTLAEMANVFYSARSPVDGQGASGYPCGGNDKISCQDRL